MTEKILKIDTRFEQTLVVKTNNYTYRIKIGTFDQVTESDIPCLNGMRSADVWRWARRRFAKVYNSDFLPANMR